MSSAKLGVLVQHLRKLAGTPSIGQTPDPQLLDDFLSRRDEAAFAELVRRHGPMVLNVCRGVLFSEMKNNPSPFVCDRGASLRDG